MENKVSTPNPEKANFTLKRSNSVIKNIAIYITIVAVAMSLFHLYTSAFGTLISTRQRAVHVGFAIVLTWLIYSPTKGLKGKRISFIDYILIFFSIFSFSYIAINAERISRMIPYISQLSTLDLIVGTMIILLLIEASRRCIGNIFTGILVICLIYVFLGEFFPFAISHSGFSYMWFIDHIVFTNNGVFGVATGVSATYIFIFLLFGAFLDKTGGGNNLINLAFSLTGKYKGGPAKAGILASGFFGMISGSAVANVVTTGPFTIPMMKKVGYPSKFAGAVEAVASSSGQIMPPLMGASAFLIAELTGTPYIEVAAAAAIPALLFLLSVFLQVHFRAEKNPSIGRIPKESIPKLLPSLNQSFPYLFPVFVIVVLLATGSTPLKAGLYATILLVIINVVISQIKKVKRISLKEIIGGLEDGAKTAVQIAVICAASGIVVGTITMTGIGNRANSVILGISEGDLFLTLLITMVMSIILGMGLPTVGAYIIQVALTIPTLINLGVPPLAAHLFIFYFGALSAITPPVAVAAYAAAGLANSNPMATGLMAVRLALAAFIVPFMFVYGPTLILVGQPAEILIDVVTAMIGIFALSASLEGWLLIKINIIFRVLLVFSAICMVYPGLPSDVVGISILIIVGMINWFNRKKH